MINPKLLRVISRLPHKRFVSSIRPQTPSVVVGGKTYQKMLYPYTWTAKLMNRDWHLYWTYFHWLRMITYSAIVVAPFGLYLHVKVYYELWKLGREADKSGHH